MERSEHIQKIQEAARELIDTGTRDYSAVWERLGDEYFLRHIPWQVAHHTRLLLGRRDPSASLVDIQPVTERGGTEIFIYAAPTDDLFSRVTAVLDQLGLNVVDAGIITTDDNYGLHTYHVLEESGEPVVEVRRIDEIRSALLAEIEHGSSDSWHVARRMPRQYKHFPIGTHVDFKLDDYDQRTVMTLVTADRPGLLSRVGRAFAECKVRLFNARIATLGARAEDVYYITDTSNRPLTDPAQLDCLKQALHRQLDQESDRKQSVFHQ
jgi:[protein-PII] uridylyltransferase